MFLSQPVFLRAPAVHYGCIMADDESIFLNKDYLYELVGCDELSTEEQIITEYKIKAKTLHPDKNSGDDEEFIRYQ